MVFQLQNAVNIGMDSSSHGLDGGMKTVAAHDFVSKTVM